MYSKLTQADITTIVEIDNDFTLQSSELNSIQHRGFLSRLFVVV